MRGGELGTFPDYGKITPAQAWLAVVLPAMLARLNLSRHELRVHLLPILLGQAAALGIGVLGVRLASHWVAPADYGVYGLFISVTPLGAGVLGAGLVKYLARHWAAAEDRNALRRTVLAAAVRKLPWLCAAAAVVATALPGRWIVLFPSLAVASAAMMLTALVQTTLQAQRENWRDCSLSVTTAVLRTLLPLVCYTAVAADLSALLGGFALHALLAAAAALWLGRWRGATSLSATIVPAKTYEGARFILLAVAGWVMGASARMIVARFFGADEAGYFALAGNMALVVVSTLYAVVLQFVQPRLFALPAGTAEERRALVRLTNRLAAGFTVAGVAGLALLTVLMPWLIGPVVSATYAPAANWVLAAGCFHLALLVPQFFHLQMLAARRESDCGPAEIAAAAALLIAAVLAAAGGTEWFRWFAIGSPLLAWLVARPISSWQLRESGPAGSGIASRERGA